MRKCQFHCRVASAAIMDFYRELGERSMTPVLRLEGAYLGMTSCAFGPPFPIREETRERTNRTETLTGGVANFYLDSILVLSFLYQLLTILLL